MINPFFPYQVYDQIRRIIEAYQMQGDYERNTGRKIKYPFHRSFEMQGFRDIASLGSGLFGGITSSKLYEGNTNITRWLQK